MQIQYNRRIFIDSEYKYYCLSMSWLLLTRKNDLQSGLTANLAISKKRKVPRLNSGMIQLKGKIFGWSIFVQHGLLFTLDWLYITGTQSTKTYPRRFSIFTFFFVSFHYLLSIWGRVTSARHFSRWFPNAENNRKKILFCFRATNLTNARWRS